MFFRELVQRRALLQEAQRKAAAETLMDLVHAARRQYQSRPQVALDWLSAHGAQRPVSLKNIGPHKWVVKVGTASAIDSAAVDAIWQLIDRERVEGATFGGTWPLDPPATPPQGLMDFAPLTAEA